MKNITITVNQQPQEIPLESHLGEVILALQLPNSGCVFAINNQVVPRSEWSKTKLNDGDAISLFQAIAGG